MEWLLELLFGAVRTMCSQFIVDMMDIASGMFTEILSCDLDLFEELFGVAGVLYRNAILPIAIVLLLMILIWQLFKSMFGKMGTASEDPVELVFRSCFCLFLIAFAKDFVNYIMEIVGTPYQWITGTEITVQSFSEYVSAAEAVTSVLGQDAISIQLLLLIMQFVVAWNYFKMLFLLAERYVLLGIFSYTSPLAFATGGSKATNNILGSWAKMFGGQVMVVILDAWCVKMFLSGYGNLMASSYGFTKFFAATMCLIGFCKITAKLDSYMGSLGVNLGRSGGGLSGLGALMMAGRLFHGGGRAATGALGNAAAAHMTFGSGRSIPLGRDRQDFADGKNSDAWQMQGAGIGGMEPGVHENGMASKPEVNGESGWIINEHEGFEPEGQSMEDSFLPFGNPEDTDQEIPDSPDMDGVDATNGIDITDGMMDSGDIAEYGNMFPGMDVDMANEGPFGIPGDVEANDIPGTENSGMEEEYPTGNAEDLLESPGNVNMPSSEEMEFYQGAELQEMEAAHDMAGGISESDFYGIDGAYGAEEVHGANESYGMEEPYRTGGGYGADEGYGVDETYGAGGALDVDGSYATTETYGVEGSYGAGEIHGVEESHDAGEIYGIEEAHKAGESFGMAENASAERGTFAGSMQASDYVPEGGEALQAHVSVGSVDGSSGLTESNGMYPVMRDGTNCMRYDAAFYGKPEGKYQTIHENGKTFYELLEGGKPPDALMSTKAVLERNGTIRIEKESKADTRKRTGKKSQKKDNSRERS